MEMGVIDRIFSAFTSVLATGSMALAGYAVPLLAALTIVHWYWRGGIELAMAGAGSLNDVLGTLLGRLLMIGVLYWLVVIWPVMTDAALESMLTFASVATGAESMQGLLTQPSRLWTMGMQVAKPIADFDTWYKATASLVGLAVSPRDLIFFLCIVVALGINMLHFGVVVVEFHLAVLAGVIFVPCGILGAVSSLSEMVLGWLIGCLVRVFVSCVMVGIALPLFALLLPEPAPPSPLQAAVAGNMAEAAASFWTNLTTVPSAKPVLDMFVMVGGAWLFCLLCVLVPSRAARLASVGLSLSGLDVAAGMATTARFAMAGWSAIRGTSRMLVGV